MSLLQKASIITTPTAYAEDFLYNIKPAGGLGDERITNGNFNTDSNWGKSSGATISNGKANIVVTSGGFEYIDQGLTYVAGKKYRLTATIQGTSGKALRFQDNASNTGGLQVSNGTVNFNGNIQAVDITWAANSNSNILIIARSGAGDFSFTIDNVSVKELVDFDFDRNSTGTRVNEDYLIEDVPYNLASYSEDLSNSSWAKQNGGTGSVPTVSSNYSIAPNGTQTADRVIFNLNGGTANADVSQIAFTFGNTSSSDFTNSVYIKSNTANNYNLVLTIPSGGFQTKTITTEWQRFTATSSNTTNVTLRIRLRGDESTSDYADVSIWGAQIVKGDQPKEYLKTTDRLDIPRIDYTNGEGSILLEPQRQNLLTYSQDFTQWGNARTTDTANQITSPDGLNNGTLLQQQSGQTNAGSIFIGGLGLASGTYTQSIYAKKKDKNFIVGYDANADRTYFNLETGKVGTVASGVTAEMIAMPNDWYRCIITYTITTGAVIAFYLADNDNSTTVTDSGGVYIYGAQLEVGSYPTSLIHTSGSAVTRSADAANNAGNSDLFNDNEGVLYAEMKALANDGVNRVITIVNSSSTLNRIRLYYTTVDNRVIAEIRNSSGGILMIYNGLTDVTTFNKFAVKYKNNDAALWVNGAEVLTDTSGGVPTGLNKLVFDDGSGSDDYYGDAKSLMVFKEALTDLELEKLTGYNNHELYMNYYNRLSYLGLAEEYNVESDINNYIL